METPNWTEILSADSALWAAIFAGLSFLATVGGIVVAVFALRWARTAAVEAGKQAVAARRSLRWARRAAEQAGKQASAALASVETARAQTALLEKQIALSEPQPVLILTVQYATGGSNSPVIEVENVGEDLAFDVQLSELPIVRQFPPVEVISTARFERLPVVKSGKKPQVRAWLNNPFPVYEPRYGHSDPQMALFMDRLLSETVAYWKEISQYNKDAYLNLGQMTIRYKNARGREFSKIFTLLAGPDRPGILSRTFECHPEGSLVDGTVIAP